MNKLFLFILCSVCFFLSSLSLKAQELPYNFEDTFYIPIKLQVMDEVSTKDGIIEGSLIKLKVKKNIYYNRELIVKKDTIATAKVETYITKGMNGFPAEIILDDFQIEGLDSSKILCSYSKKGISFALLVFPIKWLLTPLPPLGSLTNFIFGTNATIDDRDEVVLRYYPNWK